MSEIQLVRGEQEALTEPEMGVVRRFLFGFVDGLGDRGRKQWRRFWNMIKRLEPGEIVTITTHKARTGVFHRRHMLIESRVFEAQERIEKFEDFRLWLKIGSGYVTWMAGPKGGVVPVPKSISYDELDQTEFEEVHANMMAFLRSEHAIKYLWPNQPDAQRDAAMDELLSHFHE
jgi:hypothetical protein